MRLTSSQIFKINAFSCPNTFAVLIFSRFIVILINASVLDLKSHYRGLKYVHEILKILPQKPEPIVIQQVIGRLSSIGAIYNTQANLNLG